MSAIGGIGAPARPGVPARRGAAGGVSGGAFVVASPGAPASGTVAASAGPAAVAALDGLLAALEDVPPPAERDRRARAHGHALLAALAALQHELLGEPGLNGQSLHRLDALLAAIPAASDPALAALVDGVALRARIERQRRAAPPSG